MSGDPASTSSMRDCRDIGENRDWTGSFLQTRHPPCSMMLAEAIRTASEEFDVNRRGTPEHPWGVAGAWKTSTSARARGWRNYGMLRNDRSLPDEFAPNPPGTVAAGSSNGTASASTRGVRDPAGWTASRSHTRSRKAEAATYAQPTRPWPMNVRVASCKESSGPLCGGTASAVRRLGCRRSDGATSLSKDCGASACACPRPPRRRPGAIPHSAWQTRYSPWPSSAMAGSRSGSRHRKAVSLC